MPRGIPKHKASVTADDEFDPAPITQRQVPAAGMPPPPTSGARSIFDMLAKPAKARQPAAEIVIRKGVPMPAPKRDTNSAYLPVLKRMAVGDMVELPPKQAKSFQAVAKEWGNAQSPPCHFTYRTLSPQTAGVWRDA